MDKMLRDWLYKEGHNDGYADITRRLLPTPEQQEIYNDGYDSGNSLALDEQVQHELEYWKWESEQESQYHEDMFTTQWECGNGTMHNHDEDCNCELD